MSMSGAVPFSRRALMAAGASYFLPSLVRTTQAATPPKRLLIFFTIHGNPYPHWKMRRNGLADDTTWEFDLKNAAQGEFSRTFAPLYEHRDKLLILDTLSNQLSRYDAHYASEASLLTGAEPARDASGSLVGSAPSIDQIVAERIRQPGALGSLELGVATGGANGTVPYKGIWQGRGVAMPYIVDQAVAFERLFGRLPGQTGSTALTRDQKIEKRRRVILDEERARYRALATRLSGADRTRLESHASMIGDLSERLKAAEGGLQVSCGSKPEMAAGARSMNLKFENFARMITAAFACDMTRVASIQMAQTASADFGHASLGGNVHGGMAHHGNVASKILGMSDYYRVHAQQFATLLSHLRAVKEPDGSSLLDNTIALWVPEIGSWVHQTKHLPVVIGGGAGFKVGRYMHYASDVPAEVPTGSYRRLGPSHAKLLISIARQMGLTDLGQLGNIPVTPLPGLTG